MLATTAALLKSFSNPLVVYLIIRVGQYSGFRNPLELLSGTAGVLARYARRSKR
jgi:hypothetical protein